MQECGTVWTVPHSWIRALCVCLWLYTRVAVTLCTRVLWGGVCIVFLLCFGFFSSCSQSLETPQLLIMLLPWWFIGQWHATVISSRERGAEEDEGWFTGQGCEEGVWVRDGAGDYKGSGWRTQQHSSCFAWKSLAELTKGRLDEFRTVELVLSKHSLR